MGTADGDPTQATHQPDKRHTIATAKRSVPERDAPPAYSNRVTEFLLAPPWMGGAGEDYGTTGLHLSPVTVITACGAE